MLVIVAKSTSSYLSISVFMILFFSSFGFFIFLFVGFRNICNISIFEMLVCHKTESIEMLVKGGGTPKKAKYDEDRVAMDLAIDESRKDL